MRIRSCNISAIRPELIMQTALWALFALGTPGFLRAQSVGQIRGTVTDPNGAVMPSVAITAGDVATGIVRSTVTNDAGIYSFPRLPVGSYIVKASAVGFKDGISAPITIDVSQDRDVSFALTIANSIQQVQVSAAPPLLNTTNAELGEVISGRQVSTLPLNGRDITALTLLSPGVTQEVNSSWPVGSNPSGGTFVAGNGNRGTTGASYLDGLDTSDVEFGGPQLTNFNLDAIAEFRFMQNNYSAQYGRGAGTIEDVVSKSGTNQLHGSLFEFVRNSVFDARNWFSTTVPPFRRNEFGATIGGPILKRKFFYFAEYAGFRQSLGEPTFVAVPTQQQRQGIVDITGANGVPDELLVPLNPVAQQILTSYPLPNQPSGPYGEQTYYNQLGFPTNNDQLSGRIDYNISAKDMLFVRLTGSDSSDPINDPTFAVISPDFSSSLEFRQRNYGLTETHIISPTFLNTFRFSYMQVFSPWLPGNQNITQSDFSDGSLSTWGPSTGCCSQRNTDWVFDDSINWSKGKHSITAGTDYRWEVDNPKPTTGLQGSFVFEPGQPLLTSIPSRSGDNDLSAGQPSPSSLLSFMEGDPTYINKIGSYPGYALPGQLTQSSYRRWHLSGWFEDDFKVQQKLTLNLGFRYEYNSVPFEVRGVTRGIVDDPDFKGGSLYRQVVVNAAPLYFPDYDGFGPRFGLAYSLSSKTIFRGGFGIFTNLPLTQTADQQTFGYTSVAVGLPNPNFPFSLEPTPLNLPPAIDKAGNVLPPGGDLKNVPQNDPLDLRPIAEYLGNPLVAGSTDMHLRNGYTMAGNVTLERELGWDSVWQMSYVMNNAVRLYSSWYPNAYAGAETQYTPYSAANPGLGEVQLTSNRGHSTYNALQLLLRKNSSRSGLTYQAAYTWSKAIDNATTVFNGPATNSAALQNNPTCTSCEKADSANDVPHRFVLNAMYDLPLAKFTHHPGRLSDGWQLSGIYQIQKGNPFTVNSPFGTVQFGSDEYIGFQGTRPDLVQMPTRNSKKGPQFFSDAVVADGANLGQKYFSTPGALTTGLQDHPGNLSRNTFRADHFSNTDLSLIKNTQITEGKILQIRAEFFNAYNQHAFGAPGAELGSAGFGQAGGTVLPERQIQFAARMTF